MAFETVKLYKLIVLDIDTAGACTLQVYTEQPGSGMTLRSSHTVNTETTTTGRLPVKIILGSNTKGRQLKLKITAGVVVRLYGAKVLYRMLGEIQPSGWGWGTVPVEITPDLFATVRLPIEPTPDGFSSARLPIEPTPDGFSSARLPIDPTPDGWGVTKVPMRETPDYPQWFDLPGEAA